jgi:hypothetical protein
MERTAEKGPCPGCGCTFRALILTGPDVGQETCTNCHKIVVPSREARSWKDDVTVRKEQECHCCDEVIPEKGHTVVYKYRVGLDWKSDYYCPICGPLVKAGKSFEEARATKAHTEKSAFDI